MIKKFLGYAIPSALAMFVSSLYTIIDGIFVGQGVGDNALAAVTIVMPLTIMLFGIATMFAVGGGALVSKNFGAEKDHEGINVFRQVFKFLLIISIVISLILAVFASPIVSILGATESIKPLASELEIAYNGLNITNLGFFIVGLNLTTTVYYQAVEVPKYSNLMCILRSVIFLPVSIFFLMKLLGVNGVWLSLLVSELLSLIAVNIIANVKVYTKNSVVA